MGGWGRAVSGGGGRTSSISSLSVVIIDPTGAFATCVVVGSSLWRDRAVGESQHHARFQPGHFEIVRFRETLRRVLPHGRRGRGFCDGCCLDCMRGVA